MADEFQEGRKSTHCVDLWHRWRAHQHGHLAACATIFAVFGVHSPLGRFADNRVFHGEFYEADLRDATFHYGCTDDHVFDSVKHEPSAAAAAMIAHGLRRRDRSQRLDMTPEAHRALVDFYHEKLVLIDEIAPLVTWPGMHSVEAKFINGRITWHTLAVRKALDQLGEAP